MKRRPLFAGAVFAALLIWLLFGGLKLSYFPAPPKSSSVLINGIFLKAEEKKNSVYLYLKQAKADSVSYGRVILVVGQEEYRKAKLLPGNRIEGKAEREGFRKARNAGNFDEESYYHSLGIAEKFQLEGKLLVSGRQIYPVHAAMQWVRARLNQAILSVGGGAKNSHAAVFSAIVTGDRSGLEEETKELYRKSGIAHILAISGLHISLIGMSLFSMLRKRLGFTASAGISAAVMVLFCIMSGESASALRATIMFLVRIAAMGFGKRFDLLSALGLSAVLLLLSNPFLLFYSGFQLSFGAILGIALFSEVPESWLSENKRLRSFQKAFFASLSVTMFTLPVIINSYYEIPVFSVFLNLIAVPLMGMVLGSGLLSAFAGLLSLFLGRIVAGGGVYLVSLIELLCGISDAIPFSILITGNLSPPRVLIYYGILAVLYGVCFRRRKKRRKGRAAAAVILFLCLLLTVFGFRENKSLRLTFFDVDQGESILLESPSGMVCMIDAGSASVKDVYRYRLESALKYKGIRKIDLLIVTHPDTDHLSAVLDMLKEKGAGSITIGKILTPAVPDNANYQELSEAAEKRGIPLKDLSSGMEIGDSVISLCCLHPDPGFRSEEANSGSAVLELSFGAFKALFTGDIGKAEEELLLKEHRLSDVDLLKVGHHGSRYSSSKEFLKTIKPETAIISAGVNNSYGHPHKEVLERLAQVGSSVYSTPLCGEIEVEVEPDGTGRLCKYLTKHQVIVLKHQPG